jgi:hypothetical protein
LGEYKRGISCVLFLQNLILNHLTIASPTYAVALNFLDFKNAFKIDAVLLPCDISFYRLAKIETRLGG